MGIAVDGEMRGAPKPLKVFDESELATYPNGRKPQACR
jgi:hypothetical protein